MVAFRHDDRLSPTAASKAAPLQVLWQFPAEMSPLNVTRTAKFGKHGAHDHISLI